LPSTSPSAPLPATDLKPETGGSAAPSAAVSMAWARGCSERRSSAAASDITSASPLPFSATVRETIGRPSVRVPVLSKARALSLPAASSAAPPLTRIPRREAAPIPETTVTGVEITRAHGQAMMRSASVR
jgi:hypothetical protein